MSVFDNFPKWDYPPKKENPKPPEDAILPEPKKPEHPNQPTKEWKWRK